MYSDQDVIEAFAHWWIKIGGTSEAFDELKGLILKQIIEQELGDFGQSLDSLDFKAMQANHPPLPDLPPFHRN